MLRMEQSVEPLVERSIAALDIDDVARRFHG